MAIDAPFKMNDKSLILFTILISLLSKSAAFSPSMSPQHQTVHNEKVDDRRSFLSNIITGTAVVANIPLIVSSNPYIANAEEVNDKFTSFKDPNVGFQVQVPSGWTKSEQMLSDRRKIVLFINGDQAEKASEDLIFVAYTPVRDDFTSLASFGSVDQVGQATILPKGQLAGQETENEMLSSESKKNSYYFDYTSKSPGQPKRHFRTIFSLIQGATGGAGSVLVSITAQTLESRYDAEMKSKFEHIIDSFEKL